MFERFVPLAEFLRPAAPHTQTSPPAPDPPAAPAADDYDEALAAARRFRAALADAVDAALPDLLRAIAMEVIGRELQAAPADLGALAAKEIARHADEALRLRAHPAERAALTGLAVQTTYDERLQRGELRIDLASGTIASTLASRLDRVLQAWR